jgi:hypothetical protein
MAALLIYATPLTRGSAVHHSGGRHYAPGWWVNKLYVKSIERSLRSSALGHGVYAGDEITVAA